nr:hypothetical protein [Actinomycetales bacterium]
MTRSRFRWLFALLALLALPWALGATSPPDEPRPTAGPGDSTVLAWLRDEGQSAITASEGSGLTPEQLAAVAWTQPTRMATWTDGFLDGQPGAPPVEDLDVWFAPLVLDG